MLRVNLLPWRENYRDKRYRLWRGLLLAGVTLEMALMLLFGLHSQHQLRLGESRQTELITQHAALQSQLETVNLLKSDYQRAERLALQGQQRFERSMRYVQILQHLSQTIPQGVWVTQLHQNSGEFRLDGASESYSDILALSQALRHEGFLPKITLREVKQLPASALSFSFNAALVTLGNQSLENQSLKNK